MYGVTVHTYVVTITDFCENLYSIIPFFTGMRVGAAYLFVGCRGQLSVGILVPIPELGSSVSLPQELNFPTGEIRLME